MTVYLRGIQKCDRVQTTAANRPQTTSAKPASLTALRSLWEVPACSSSTSFCAGCPPKARRKFRNAWANNSGSAAIPAQGRDHHQSDVEEWPGKEEYGGDVIHQHAGMLPLARRRGWHASEVGG